jgi:outer membrane protein insertion porin family
MRVQPGAPLSQKDMLESQRRLYDLGLFKQVDTAIQNPDGTESRKNVLVTTSEADRYTFDYGGGFEFQTGQPAYGTNQPLGRTGVSPMVSLGVSRINVGGRHQTSPEGQPRPPAAESAHQLRHPQPAEPGQLFVSPPRRSTTTPWTSPPSPRNGWRARCRSPQVLYKMQDRELTTFAYRFSYRRVEASDIEVTSNLIPLLSSQPGRHS